MCACEGVCACVYIRVCAYVLCACVLCACVLCACVLCACVVCVFGAREAFGILSSLHKDSITNQERCFHILFMFSFHLLSSLHIFTTMLPIICWVLQYCEDSISFITGSYSLHSLQ